MTDEAINEELIRKPFVPLRLYLDDGRQFEVYNPSLCIVNFGSMYVARTDRPDSRLAADMDLISISHIARVELIPEDERAGGDTGPLRNAAV